MTGDEYMALLEQRRDAYEAEHPTARAWVRPLLEWFIRPGDEALVALPTTAPKRQTTPRTYRTAESLRADRDRVDAEIRRLSDSAALPDRAASHGVALGRARTARHQARADRALARAAELYQRLSVLDGRIARAERRETTHSTTDGRNER
ncbi:hypothetical protein QUV83_08125 [Cellulomonas cellasea]|uniref:hypothetical protein n=1 Tax=Cellulomonas cellasea TaxID=43670 RepID=UPI0025A44250|nr:hypothetical protein [Cellulomonas cellasea]MDM8084726.1 hypothetical protein [Cellulomonas cellasea]